MKERQKQRGTERQSIILSTDTNKTNKETASEIIRKERKKDSKIATEER